MAKAAGERLPPCRLPLPRQLPTLLYYYWRVESYWKLGYYVALTCCMEDKVMPANAVVRARIDKELKEEASVVLASIGLTVSDAFRMMLVRVVAEKALPFDPLVPNEDTIAAMRDARLGNVQSFETVEALMDDLKAPD